MKAERRVVHGALVVDKPAGITSAGVLRRLERAWNVRGLGHAGTLDPMATGLLLVLAGAATKLQFLFLESEKRYSGAVRLGQRTDTDDIEGEILEQDESLEFASRLPLAEWQARIAEQFSGSTLQLPPQYSAIRVGGRKSYEAARRGESLPLTHREVTIQFERLEFETAARLHYRVRCSKGTYVRSLARDIGSFLGTFGCLESIRRESVGAFSLSGAVNLDEAARLGPDSLAGIEELVAALPAFCLDDADCLRLKQGIQSPLAAQRPTGGGDQPHAAIYSAAGAFQGLAERTEEAGNWRIRFLMPQNN